MTDDRSVRLGVRLAARTLFCLLLLAAPAWSQAFIATKQTSLSGAAEVVTVQQPVSGARTVSFIGAYVDCSVACNITLERDGTAATATALTVVALNSGTPAATAWSSSDVGTGTVLARYKIPATGGLPINLAMKSMSGANTAKNLTLRTDSITGTVTITVVWTENK